MNFFKHIYILFILFLLLISSGCKQNSTTKDSYDIYLFNSKLEIANSLDALAELYEQETGVKIKTFTPESGSDYMAQLNEQLDHKGAPSIFTLQGISELNEALLNESVLDFNTIDNTKFKIFQDSIPNELKLNMQSSSYGIPYGIDGYGFIVDRQLISDLFEQDVDVVIDDIIASDYYEFQNLVLTLEDYIRLDLKKDITLNFNKYTLQDNKSDLVKSLEGIFIVMGAEPWTYIDNAINIPLSTIFSSQMSVFYASALEIKDLYQPLRAYAKTLDLMTSYMIDQNGATTRSEEFINPSNNDFFNAIKIFSENKAMFMQSNSSIYNELLLLNEQQANRLEFIPIKNLLNQKNILVEKAVSDIYKSIPVSVTSYYAINGKSSKKEQELAMNFLLWLNRSDSGRNFILNSFNFIPYDGNEYNESVKNPLGNSILKYMSNNNTLSTPSLGMPHEVLQNIQFALKSDYMVQKIWTSDDYTDISNLIIDEWTNFIEKK
jgi:raffinose/stachyose/melibiose transport system substrate-binding protein